MPTSESSYADRHARGQTMHDIIAEFTPAFAPTDANIAPTAFQSYLNGVEAANDAVSDAEATLKPLTDQRAADAEALRDKALRIKSFVSANVAWKKWLPAIKTAADAMRGYRVNKKPATTPPGGGGEPAPKAGIGARTQRGYGDMEKLFGKLLIQVQKITGYTAPAASGLTVAELQAQDAAFVTLNDDTSEAEATLGEKQRERSSFYDGEGGLREKMKAIKAAVRAQYGNGSPEHVAVKGIAL